MAELAMAQSRFDVRIGWEAARKAVGDADANALVVGDAANALGAALACSALPVSPRSVHPCSSLLLLHFAYERKRQRAG